MYGCAINKNLRLNNPFNGFVMVPIKIIFFSYRVSDEQANPLIYATCFDHI